MSGICVAGFTVQCGLLSTGQPRKVRQYRSIELTGRRLTIEDRAAADGREIVSRILLHPAVAAENANKDMQLSRADGLSDGLSVRVHLSKGARLSIEDAEWWPDMGAREATQRVIASGAGRVRVEISVLAETTTS